MSNFDSLRWLAEQGARFALPFGRTKNKFEDGWPEKPHTLDEAITHARRGGNVGILTGKHSGGIVALDRDVDFPATCEMLGDLAKTAKIIRDNAPGRGKFLYWILGDIPPSAVWKENPTDKHPAAEFLAKGRHALTEPSVIDGGNYRIIDSQYGIQTITAVELDHIWRLITGGSIDKETRAREDADRQKAENNEFIRQVKNKWPVEEIFKHFDKDANGSAKDRGEIRLLGNGGLLVSADGKQWYCHADAVGGDNLDAWAWCKWGKRVDRGNPVMFWDTVNSMADAAGIARPPRATKPTTNGYHAPVEVPEWAAAPPMGDKPVEAKTPPTDDIQKFFLFQSADDEGNAQCVNRLHGKHFLYCDAYGWMQNVGTHWIYSGLAEKEINLAITHTLIERRVAAVKAENEKIIKATKPSSANKNNTRNMFKDIVWCDVGMFDQAKHLLNCQNGVVDLRSGQLITNEPSSHFTYCVNAEYQPGVNTEEWTNFLSATIGNYDQIHEWLQMACGYSITGYTNEEIMFYNYGPTRSGKGTFMNAYLHMLGQPLAMGMNFSTFTAKREGDSQNFDLAPLKPSRFIAASESGKHQALNEAVIKQITGNDPIRAAYKGKDQFTYFPQFKIWLSSNHPVKGDVDDDAFWGRVKVIDFPNSHLGNEDKSLKERMQAQTYSNMVLAWTVIGARLWHIQDKGLTTPTSVQATVAEQRAQLDSIQRWLDECTQRKEGVNTANDALRRSYEDWCRQNGEMPKFAVQFGKSMNAKGYEPTNVKDHGMSKRGYKDITLLAPEPVDSSHDRIPSIHFDG
jgi:putative DNA primase/helicase